jgi:hypothetical protein
MKTKYLSLLIAVLMLFAASCKKTGLHPTTRDAVIDTAVDVYTAGYITTSNGLGGITEVAAYWKNGVITKLTDSLSFCEAKGIAVVGTDVYVVGYISSLTNPFNENAVLWKNGVATILSPDSTASEATFIGVSGMDVYVGGLIHDVISQTSNSTSYGNQPVYWKNGTPNLLPKATSITGIAFNGSDVYIAGSVVSPNKFTGVGMGNGSVAAYWKNGTLCDTLAYPAIYLPAYSSAASAIAVNGNNVYTAGSTAIYQPEMWQNNTPTILANTTAASTVKGIATNGTDVYVAGTSGNFNVATYWMNNVPTTLSAGAAISMTNSFAAGIALNGSDVYVAAQVKHTADQEYGSYYWKNGVPVQLSGGAGKGAYVTGIALAPKN